MNNNIKEKNMFQAIIRNEITWIIVIVGAVIGVVKEIVLPIQKLQIKQEEIQFTLNKIQDSSSKVLSDHEILGNRLTKVETILKINEK